MSVKGSKLQVVKVKSSDTDDFSETLDFTLLYCNNFNANNNKFYIIEIQRNSKGEYQLFSNYGRLGKTSIYEIRTHFKNESDSITDLSDITSEYDAIIAKKERGKTTKGIKEFYVKVGILSPTVGSKNIFSNDNITLRDNIDITIDSHHDITRIIEQLKKDNIHNILTKTSLTLTSRGLETDVGIVTESHIDIASKVLNNLRDSIIDKNEDNITRYNNEYFSLIPKKFVGALSKNDMITDATKLSETYDLLDNLKNALKTMINNTKNTDSGIIMDISILEDMKEFTRLSNFFEDSKHKDHAELNIWKIKNIFKFNETDNRKHEYEDKVKNLGNEYELFHGSRNTNILSILINGFMIPPASAGYCTGRMFGDGVYSASCSTKALNYSTGYWDNTDNDNNAFIFITRFVMGREQKCKKFKYDGVDAGYDSIHGLNKDNGGTLLNDEYVVYDVKQTLITHLIELSKI